MGPVEKRALAASLKKISFFADLPKEDRDRLQEAMHLYAFEPGRKTVFKKGHIGDALYIVRKGAVEIFKPHFPLPRRPIRRLRPGDAFGEMALLNQPYRTASAITDGYTELFVLLRHDFHALFHSNHPLLQALHQRAQRRVVST
jgi:CRP-like cAMP-binding protein